MEHILEKLFESTAKARTLRMFVRNIDSRHTFADVLKRTGLKPKIARAEMLKLLKIGLLRTKMESVRKDAVPLGLGRRGRKKISVRKERVYYVNALFPALTELKNFVIKSSVASRKKLLSQMRRLGNVKLAVVSGIFLDNDQSRTDLLIVGDQIKRRRFNSLLESLESELGKSIRYTLMDSKEFSYRMNMYDRFLRDILEYPHDKLIARTRT